MSDNFYRAFEEKYRGPSELIISRLRAYLPFISPLKEIYPVAPATDLGCGRGEWLELLLQEDFLPQGVDQDEEMLQGCVDRNLPAQKGDATEYLSTLPDESQTIVSAFHVVEHISFDQLRTLVSEALRVLKPGGLLIMETPNPESIAVATKFFYLDPTHQRPIPPQLLSFLPEYYGFSRTKIMRLQESKELVGKLSPTLNDVFEGVSPDYAVIAQKTASTEILELFDHAFNQEYGLQLNTLAERYDTAFLDKVHQAEVKARQVDNIENQLKHIIHLTENKVHQAEVKARQVDNIENQLKYISHLTENNAHNLELELSKLQQEIASFELTQQELHSQIGYWHGRVLDLHQSTSWRITRPLRFIKKVISGEIFETTHRIRSYDMSKKVLYLLIRSSINFVSNKPYLRSGIISITKKFPRLHQRLVQFSAKGNLTFNTKVEGISLNSNETIILTPYESEINKKLKKVINEKGADNADCC